MTDHLEYPNLDNCQVSVCSAAASSRPPVRLSQECIDAANGVIPDLYDFSLEKDVLKQKEAFDSSLIACRSREELEQATIVRMKSVTGASEDVCIAALDSNGWELNTSIETFFKAK